MPATMMDIARDLNVSVVTVSKVLRNQGRISDSTRKRVLRRAKQLNYQMKLGCAQPGDAANFHHRITAARFHASLLCGDCQSRGQHGSATRLSRARVIFRGEPSAGSERGRFSPGQTGRWLDYRVGSTPQPCRVVRENSNQKGAVYIN